MYIFVKKFNNELVFMVFNHKKRILNRMYMKRNIGLTNCQVKRLASAVDNGTPVSFTK